MTSKILQPELTRRQLNLNLLKASASIGLLSLGGKAFAADTPKRGGKISVAFVGSPVKLDPHVAAGAEEWALLRSVYDSLVYADPKLSAQPELAERWEASPGSDEWTFFLRKGVKFHHGRELDADDVVFSFKRILDPNTASPARSAFGMVKSIDKLDDHTVRFTLNSPFAEFPLLCGGSFQAKIAPRDVPDLNKTPCGTGPFKLTEFVPGDHVTLSRFDGYWRNGEPWLDEVRVLFLPEEATQVSGIMSGSLDMAWWPSAEMLPVYKASPDVRISVAQSYGYQPIVMRVDHPPFDKPEVRKAFRLICDRSRLKQVVLGDLDVPVSNDHPIPPFSDMYMQQTPPGQDIETAKKLLADAGYKDGLEIELMSWTGRGGLVQSALAYQDMAKEAGVQIRVNTVPSDIFLSKYWLKHPFVVTNWNGRSTLYEMLALAYLSNAKWNESGWKSPEMDELIGGVQREQDETKRKKIFADIQTLFIDHGPTIVAYHRPSVMAYRKHIQGFVPHPTGWLDFRTTWLA